LPDVIPSSIKIYLSRLELSDLLPNYKPKKVPSKPPIRPPINFDTALPSAPEREKERENAAKLKKGHKAEESNGGGVFGWSRK
jgi:hypothetical protein